LERYFEKITVDPEIEYFELGIWYGVVDLRIDKKVLNQNCPSRFC